MEELLLQSPTVIGEGVNEDMTKESLEKNEAATEEFKNLYSKYFDEYGFEDFQQNYILSLRNCTSKMKNVNWQRQK